LAHPTRLNSADGTVCCSRSRYCAGRLYARSARRAAQPSDSSCWVWSTDVYDYGAGRSRSTHQPLLAHADHHQFIVWRLRRFGALSHWRTLFDPLGVFRGAVAVHSLRRTFCCHNHAERHEPGSVPRLVVANPIQRARGFPGSDFSSLSHSGPGFGVR
jgi:hypothetical protein